MINILFNKDTGYEVSKEFLVKNLSNFLKENGVDYDASLSLLIASEKRLVALAMKYMGETRGEAKGHPVLSFCEDDVDAKFVLPPEEKKRRYLGELVVSYEYAASQARRERKDINETLLEWAKHGALHLLGIHHE